MKVIVDKVPNVVSATTCLFATDVDDFAYFMHNKQKLFYCRCTFDNKICHIQTEHVCPYLKSYASMAK